MRSSRNTKKGITLIEALVSLSLLSFAVAGPMTLAAHSIKASGAVRNELIATHLAEEGLELMRNLRDNKSAEDNSDRLGANGFIWVEGIYEDCDSVPGCVIDITERDVANVWDNANAVIPCPLDCDALSTVYLNPVTGFYRQFAVAPGAPWVKTQFRRTILMTGTDDVSQPKRQVRVTATIIYPAYGGIPRTIRVTQDIYNWFPYLP